MGIMDNHPTIPNATINSTGTSIDTNSTASLSPDLAGGSSSESCPSPMHQDLDHLAANPLLHSPSHSIASSTAKSPARNYAEPDTTLTKEKVNEENEEGEESGDDYSDEIKVYNEEGAAEEEQRNSEDLKDEKTEIIKQTIEEKPSSNLPFSINNLFNFSNPSITSNTKQPNNPATNSPFQNNPFAAAAAFTAFHQQRQAHLFNPAALYSQELANHFASWSANNGQQANNPYQNAFNPFNAAFNYQQQAAAAAVFQAASRFSPSLFLPQTHNNNNNDKLASPKSEPQGHSASSSASSTSSNGSTGSSAYHSSFSGSNNSNANRFSNGNGHHSSPSGHKTSSSAKKKQNYENYHQMQAPGNGMKMERMRDNNNGLDHQHSHNHNSPSSNQHLSAPVPHVMVKQEPKKPHVKKPLNAFMLFMKEQRAAVVSECTLRESAAINQILGRKWHELERTEQAKYYEKARLARLEHLQQNPGWSARDNYGLKKKRRRKQQKVVGENGELPRKCRARYGLHQLHLWCKPCRRKKKCIRFAGGVEEVAEAGSNGSVNGGCSEDDFEAYEDDSDDCTDDDSDGEDGQVTKHPHMMQGGGGSQIQHAGNYNAPPTTTHSHYQQHLQQNQHSQQNSHQTHSQSQQQQQYQHQQHMHSQHLLNNHLLKQMTGQQAQHHHQRHPASSDLDSKALLHHQLRLAQEPI